MYLDIYLESARRERSRSMTQLGFTGVGGRGCLEPEPYNEP